MNSETATMSSTEEDAAREAIGLASWAVYHRDGAALLAAAQKLLQIAQAAAPVSMVRLTACIDCVQEAINGDGAGEDWQGLAPWLAGARFSTDSGDPFFGRFPCEACGGELAGDRLPLVAMW